MFRTGARGARVSPDPWGSDEEEQINNTINDEMEMQAPPSPRQKTPPKSPAPPPKAPPVIPPPVFSQPVKDKKELEDNVVNGDVKPKEPKSDFVYQRSSKKDIDNEQLEKYLNARFATSTRAWTPYLGERYRYA